MTASRQALAAAHATSRQWKASDDRRDAGLSADVPGVTRFADIVYGPAGSPWNTLDVSVPTHYLNGTAAAPVIVSIHGGGWFYGTKHTYEFWASRMAEHDFAVVNFSYRLPPEVEFPGELDDVSRVIGWVAAHAARYHLDPHNVYVIGDSAGGQMAMQYLTVITNPAFNRHFGYPVPALTFRAVIDNCGAAFIDRQMAPSPASSATDSLSLSTHAYFTEDAVGKDPERLRTEKYMTTALPPILLVTANQDMIRDDSVRLDGFLMAKGIRHEFRSYGTPENPRMHVFMYNEKDPIGRQCRDDEAAFLRHFLAK